MKKVQRLENGFYIVDTISTSKDANGNDVQVVSQTNSLSIEEVNFFVEKAQSELDMWLDVVSQIEGLDA